MPLCNPNGRDCIQKNSAKTFNCSTSCTGIYADVQWVGSDIKEEINDDIGELRDSKENVGDDLERRVAFLEWEIKQTRKYVGEIVKRELGKAMTEEDKKKFKKLIHDYRKFKSRNVKYFRFNRAADMSTYGLF